MKASHAAILVLPIRFRSSDRFHLERYYWDNAVAESFFHTLKTERAYESIIQPGRKYGCH